MARSEGIAGLGEVMQLAFVPEDFDGIAVLGVPDLDTLQVAEIQALLKH